MMYELCSNCSVCNFLPHQTRPRFLALESEKTSESYVLIIDSYRSKLDDHTLEVVIPSILGRNIRYTYTVAQRCFDDREPKNEDEVKISTERCSVWTRQLLDDRKVIITTTLGLEQMGITGKDEGAMFKSAKYGVVLVIPELVQLQKKGMLLEYRPRIERVLKEAGLI